MENVVLSLLHKGQIHDDGACTSRCQLWPWVVSMCSNHCREVANLGDDSEHFSEIQMYGLWSSFTCFLWFGVETLEEYVSIQKEVAEGCVLPFVSLEYVSRKRAKAPVAGHTSLGRPGIVCLTKQDGCCRALYAGA